MTTLLNLATDVSIPRNIFLRPSPFLSGGHRKVVTSTDTAATWSLNPEKPWAGDRLGPPLFGILFIRNDSRVKLDRFFKVIFHTLLGR